MRISKLNIASLFITLGITLIAFLSPDQFISHGGWISIVMIVLLGIPHGATDHILFRHINKDYRKGYLYRFLVRYLLLMGLFMLSWWVLPNMAFIVFILISAYHFGQSNWSDLEVESWEKQLIYSFWGAFVLAAPLFWNYSETMPIVKQLTSLDLSFFEAYQQSTPLFLLAGSILIILYFGFTGKINTRKAGIEIINLLVLSIMFYTLPLLAGFAVYFVFWHSTWSIKDQINHFKTVVPQYTLKHFILQSLPFSMAAILSVGLFAYFASDAVLSDVWLSRFFIFISIVTLPHSILMDSLLESNDEEDEKIKSRSNMKVITRQGKIQYDKDKVIKGQTFNQKIS